MRPVPELSQLTLVHRGKVRDVYALDERHLVLVATDRLSAFDVVMAEPVPDKGRILTAMSVFWFSELAAVAPNHLLSTALDDLPVACRKPELSGRVMIVRRAEMLPIECIVRGYVAGSAWKEYAASGTVHGERLPPGLVEADRLERPRFTPSTKSREGHDVNIAVVQAADLVGPDLLGEAMDMSLSIYEAAAARAGASGIILADTKFELGLVDGRLVVADELLTPDSSRLWEHATWAPGSTPISFDKQPVRDHLDSCGWDRMPPPPSLSVEVLEATRRRYLAVYERVTGLDFTEWAG